MPSLATETSRARRRWPWVIALLLIALPIGLTLAGVATSPPRAARAPVGRIVYLEADEPSDHTTLLRGLRITDSAGGSRELLHETEPQDTDSGSREWISQPKASPDGHGLAFEKQVITLQEEKRDIINQLWVMPIDAPNAKPRLLLDLTHAHLKQFVGLAWTADSRQIVFLNDTRACLVSLSDGQLTFRPLPPIRFLPPPSAVSFTGLPLVFPKRIMYGYVKNDTHYRYIAALTPDKTCVANATVGLHNNGNMITTDGGGKRFGAIHARWGWSVFGRRQITSLIWSPDSRYIGYTVSKPPFEDELFYADTRTGQCYQLPIRTGRAAWDWTR